METIQTDARSMDDNQNGYKHIERAEIERDIRWTLPGDLLDEQGCIVSRSLADAHDGFSRAQSIRICAQHAGGRRTSQYLCPSCSSLGFNFAGPLGVSDPQQLSPQILELSLILSYLA